ncbi:2-C-methyl-D-erythritol 2,4-cyclodiphosphate synthase [Congregibacter litoralis]|uniref:2-C-methyl-D-erythritol 2,4-cyclodiphosphate synthase n=1 Tax=Congregibacter litoralis KT71 TaxID=314285 RepID=A4AAC1_9GAMM|nr:2-C-methyl-D-erythritol 2,4-cyclodiphosphate synthase [Congregibacter litoralis]EAQ96998.1 2-C-methyl-D-erythritol 2,4-cyclodiphosphate synthase [Congregibacter litoralis KT71]
MRIGHGFDVHAFAEAGQGDDTLVLGGVSIPHDRALLAHSDGDVVLHAVCDALLGAIAAGDIGKHFPDTDAANAGIDSRELLRRCMKLVTDRGYGLGNLDITIVAQTPRMAAHIDAMRSNIAGDLGAAKDQVSVKATTTERLGYVGREEGIAAHAVVLLAAS